MIDFAYARAESRADRRRRARRRPRHRPRGRHRAAQLVAAGHRRARTGRRHRRPRRAARHHPRRRRPAHRRAHHAERDRRAPARRRARGRAGLGVPAGRVGADPQPGHARRQRAAAHPLPVLPRRGAVPWPCNRRAPGSGCAALAGLHERHAIFGWTEDCVAVQPSDPAVALAALDAVVDVVGPAGPRADPDAPSSTSPREERRACGRHRLEPDELIVGYRIPSSPARRPTSRSASGRPTSTRSSRRPPSWAARPSRGSRSARWRASRGGCPTWSACRSPGRRCCPPSSERMADANPLPHNGFKVTMARNAAVRAAAHGGRCAGDRHPRVGGAPPSSPAAAPFAADHRPEGVLHAVLVGAPSPPGALRGVDAAAARALPGRHRRAHRGRPARLPPSSTSPAAVLTLPFTDDRIPLRGLAGRDRARRVDRGGGGGPRGRRRRLRAPSRRCCSGTGERDARDGRGRRRLHQGRRRRRPRAGRRRASSRPTSRPPRHHNTMETSGTVARWDGDRLTLWDAVQAGSTVIPVVSTAFGIDAANVRVVSPHTGGGFGGKGYIWPHEILAAAAARVAGRPVKLHLRRADQFCDVGYQPWMEQTIRLAADADGRAARRRARRRQQRGPGRDARRAGHRGEQVALRRRPRSGCGWRSSGSASTCRRRCAPPSRGRGCGRWRAR